MYCKDFQGLSVLSLYEGELLGVVDKLFFDKKLKKLNEVELIGENGIKLVLPTKNIYRIGKNAITVKNNQAVKLNEIEKDFCVAPIQVKAYSITGEFLGVVQEISFNDKYVTDKILLENGELLDVKDLATCGKSAVVFYNNQKFNINNFEPKLPKIVKKKNVQIVKTMPVEKSIKQDKIEVKEISSAGLNFLIGRVCTKDIFNFNNELLIKAYGVVNKKNLKEINKFGKLRELMLYLK